MKTFDSHKNRKSESGFSLIELIISMVVMVVILGAIFALMRSSLLTSSANYELTKSQQEARFAQEYINRDLVSAGVGVGSTEQIWLPATFVSNYLSTQDLTPFRDPTNTNYVLMQVLTQDNNVPANTQIRNLDGTPSGRVVLPGSDRLTILTADPDFASIPINPQPVSDEMPINASAGTLTFPNSINTNNTTLFPGGVQAGQIYYISNGPSATFAEVSSSSANSITFVGAGRYGFNDTSANGPLALLQQPPNKLITIRRMFLIQYFADSNGVLTRRVIGGGTAADPAARDEIIASNISNLNFEYSFVPSGFASVFTQPSQTLDTIKQSRDVKMVGVNISVNSRPIENGAPVNYTATHRTSVRNIPFGLAPVPIDVEGNVEPTPTPTPTPIPTPTATPTPTPIPTPTPVPTPTPIPTPTPVPTPTRTPTPTPVPTPTRTPTPTPRPTPGNEG